MTTSVTLQKRQRSSSGGGGGGGGGLGWRGFDSMLHDSPSSLGVASSLARVVLDIPKLAVVHADDLALSDKVPIPDGKLK